MLQETKKSKKGVSVVVGYVLLIVLAVAMGGIMYTWMKSYPEGLEGGEECPDGTAMAIIDYNYSCTTKILDMTLRNNGRFDIAGYYIRASNSTGLDLASFDVHSLTNGSSGPVYHFSNAVVLGTGNENSFTPGLEIDNYVNSSSVGTLTRIEITPVRWQRDKDNRLRFVNCGTDSVLKEDVVCS